MSLIGWILLGVGAFLALNIVVMLAYTYSVAKKVYAEQMVRTDPEKWGRINNFPGFPDRQRGRGKGRLVGVEFQVPPILRLFARHVGDERRVAGGEIAAHFGFPARTVTLRACASSPSFPAKSAILSETFSSASAV